MNPVQIKIPAWHQSTEALTSCPVLYVESAIKGNAQPGGMDSARGREVHHAGALYAAHCAKERVRVDLAAFDRFAAGAGPAAARILNGMRDSYEVDHGHLLATELTLSLDGHLHPTRIADAIAGSVAETGRDEVPNGNAHAPTISIAPILLIS